ncbi:coiled-coil domain-containing protein 178 [Antechinus flavipes]|uniref:coiled-coil domain-containing protein 178 n=1 Tax=Antechinus flavipes TaxID=38775 RepID=UPI0022362FD3|nr:coiled-coil domain-containing protein 178 [Antechinus flavipes]
MSDKISYSRFKNLRPSQMLLQALALIQQNEDIEEALRQIRVFARNRGKKTTLELLKLLTAYCDEKFDLDKELEELETIPPKKHDDFLLGYPTRRISCAVVNTPSPCVNQTIDHIEDLEIKIEECFHQFESLLRERFESPIKVQEIEGYIFPKPSDFHARFFTKEDGNLKDQTVTVLADAIHLIRTLETDRKEAEDALIEQRLRKRLICSKIDGLSFWRLQKLPFAVQQEHETCSTEILELQANLEKEMQKLKKLKNLVTKEEAITMTLKRDVQFMKDHKPLLEEKLLVETEILRKLYEERDEALASCQAVRDALDQILFQYQLAIRTSKKEKERMARDLKAAEENLEHTEKDLRNTQQVFKHYCTEVEKVKKSLDWQKEELSILRKNRQETRTKVNELTSKLIDLKKIVYFNSEKIKKLEEECETSLNEYQDAKKLWASEIRKLQNEFAVTFRKADLLMKKNKLMEKENQAAVQKIKTSISKKREHILNVHDLKILKSQYEEILEKLLRDIAHVTNIYNVTKVKIDEWEKRLMEERKKFMLLEAYFKKLIRDQTGLAIMIKNRMETVMAEHEEQKKYMTVKKEEALQALSEVEAPFQELLQEVARVRELQDEQIETIQALELHKEAVVRRRTQVQTDYVQRKSEMLEAIVTSKKKRVTLIKEIEQAKTTVVTLTEEIKHTKEELKTKREEKLFLDEKLGKLREIYEFTKFNRDNYKELFDMLIDELKILEVRISQERKAYDNALIARKDNLHTKTIKYHISLEENLRLAQEYQHALKQFLQKKDWYLDEFHKKISAEAAIRDGKQLLLLQERMHFALVEYFILRTLFSELELEMILRRAHGNICRVILLERKADTLVQRIIDFMQSLSDGSWKTEG